ncbi:MAG: hypothetical protein Q8Q95_01585 [bacterium]|nr:hypothetical protein [bacterium]
MAVIVTKEIKKKRILLAVFGVLVLVSFGILYFGFFGSSSPPPVQPEQSAVVAGTPSATVADQVSDLKVKILEDERFKSLQIPPGVPIETQTTGKSNPFSD